MKNRNSCAPSEEENPLLVAALDGSLDKKLRHYLKSCRPPEGADLKKEMGRLPNPAGFCTFLGCGRGCMEELREQLPRQFDYLISVFEDELLNAARLPSAGLASAYLRTHLGFGVPPTDDGNSGDVRVVFEHDIEEDGA